MNDMSLKAKINNIAKSKNISPQAILQNYLMSRFLYRLSQTEYKDKFVIKGGMLISSIIGIEHRSTMDLDGTLRNIPLTEETIARAFDSICKKRADDGIEFVMDSIGNIRDDDEYGGYRVSYKAIFGKINAPMSMDISTGDIITPEARLHRFSDMLDEDIQFELWSYPIETILAEKVETVLSRGVDNTRPRDFYDIYVLSSSDYDKGIFQSAFEATSKHRGSYDKIINHREILDDIKNSMEMNARWKKYAEIMPYAREIPFGDTVTAIKNLFILKLL